MLRRPVGTTLDGVVIAETTHALKLKEASYPAVNYVPHEDANSKGLFCDLAWSSSSPAAYVSGMGLDESIKIRSGLQC